MKSVKKFLILLLVFLVSSCYLFPQGEVPYIATGYMTMDDNKEYEIGGLELSVVNKSEKEISSFTLVFFMYDQNGNIPIVGRNSVVLTVNTKVEGNSTLECCISLDKYLYEIPDEPYEIDYLYLSQIVYSDGSKWEDPLGIKVFSL